MNITPTHRRVALLAFTAFTAFGLGGLVGTYTAEPEVVTVSTEVPAVCADAAKAGFDGMGAARRVEAYEDRAEELAASITLSVLIADAEKMKEALSPIAEHNALEDEWRTKRDDAWATFSETADACLIKATAAEALNDR